MSEIKIKYQLVSWQQDAVYRLITNMLDTLKYII